MNVCDVQALWAATAAGSEAGNQGAVFFNIFNQVPAAQAPDDGSEEFALATQLALGLGNAGEGDKYHYQVETVAVAPTGATLKGHGFLFVPDSGMATFVIAGKGTHPLAGPGMTPGWIKVSGGGNVTCVNESGTALDTTALDKKIHVVWEDGTEDDAEVAGLRCEAGTTPGEGCFPPEGIPD